MKWIAPLALGLACTAVTPATFAQDRADRRIERDGLKLELAPLTSLQTRAFLLGRGFAAKDADFAASSGCFFRSAIGSAFAKADDPETALALNKWQIVPESGTPSTPRTREDWEGLWKGRGVPLDAATAFYWALFPTDQTFYAGDYNWGFLTFGLAAGTRFALNLSWQAGDKHFEAKLEGLQCAQQ